MRRLNDITIQVDDRFGILSDGRPRQPRLTRQPPHRQRRRGISPYVLKRTRRMILGIGLIALTAGSTVWLTVGGEGTRLAGIAHERLLDASARAGFKIADVYVEGRRRTPREDLIAALQVRRDDPIFGFDLAAARQRLEEISWIKSATLERRLPGELHLLLTEREPIAVWQNQGHYYLVDKEGLVVSDRIQDVPDLPLIVGEGAPDHAAALLAMTATEPDLQKRIKAAQWVSGRRWNISFDRAQGGIDVRLPEENPADSWHALARLEKEQQVLDRKIVLIDMRLPDRLVLRAVGGAEENAPAVEKSRQNAKPGRDT